MTDSFADLNTNTLSAIESPYSFMLLVYNKTVSQRQDNLSPDRKVCFVE